MNAGGIVVGVDGSRAARDSLRWAIAEAVVRGTFVQVITVVTTPRQDYGPVDRMQTQLIRATSAGLPDPPHIAQRSVLGSVAPALVEASRGADLLVIGRHRVPVTHDTATGPIIDYCLRAGSCPVVITPDHDAATRGDHAPVREHYRWRSYVGEL